MATKYKGFSTYNRNKKFSLTDLELVKQDLFNHFHIRRGEKLMNPEFGTIVWDLLFEPLTEDIKAALSEDVKRIVNTDPRFAVDHIVIDQYEHGLSIRLELRMLDTDETDTMILLFDRNTQQVRQSQ